LKILNIGFGHTEDGSIKERIKLTKKHILICPLDWGLGHAARCVPVIKELQKKGHHITIGADKHPLAFLQQEFPELKTIKIPGYEISYSEQGSSFQLFCESVRFYQFIKKEHQLIDKIVEENNIDMIISDNRYGLWSKKAKSIIITHQLFVKTPVGSSFAHHKIEKLLSNFDECWIPDFEGQPNLSGDLSHQKPIKIPHRFIGPLSRFATKQFVTSSVFEERKKVSRSQQIEEYDIIAIISGPEPQRTVFEKLIFKQLQKTKLKAVIVRGMPNTNVIANEVKQSAKKGEMASVDALPRNDDNIKIFNHLPMEKIYDYLQKSKIVVARSGYSTIMDLVALGKRAILVPTPCQTEQEYLANYHVEQGNFYVQKQSEFDIEKALVEIKHFSPKLITQAPLKLEFLNKKD